MRLIASIISVVLLLASIVGFFAWRAYTSHNDLTQEVTAVLPRGSGFAKSLEILSDNKVISQPFLVKIAAYATGDALFVKAGEYAFPAGAAPRDVFRILAQGKVVKYKITIAEGLNVREITELLNANSVLEGAVPNNIEEGSLFPETYYFVRGDNRASIISRMQDKMEKTISELWEKREQNLPLSNKKQALTLASIVEKETGVASERPRIAGVFINRLRKNMPLQSDPTVVYGIEKETGSPLNRPLVIPDLRIPTAHNTYIIPALPPTPIANPSRAAIEAVLHPLKTNELYFVATGSGGHNFATSLDEHNQNVKKYRESLGR